MREGVREILMSKRLVEMKERERERERGKEGEGKREIRKLFFSFLSFDSKSFGQDF